MMSEISVIDEKIKQLKDDLENVHGTKTEVYTRIVGYYRPVKNWNAGKAAELKTRVYYGNSRHVR